MTGGFLFIVPRLDVERTRNISGGNLYNLGLTSALLERGVALRIVDLAGGEAALGESVYRWCFVDSLYLDALPRLRRARGAGPRTSLELIAHYLPSLVRHGAIPRPDELSLAEREALATVDGVLAPSAFMANAIDQLTTRRFPARIVAPAIEVDSSAAAPHDREAPLRAVLVGNLVPGKGVLPLLEALAAERHRADSLELTIIGSLERDPEYARACRSRAADNVSFAGELGHDATLDRVRASDLFVSASRMESFGLALAEARALGIPIVARNGGNVAAHVEERAGGRLFENDAELARECLRLAADHNKLTERQRAAQRARPPRRSWSDAANDLLLALDLASE